MSSHEDKMSDLIVIDYTNYEGKRKTYVIQPQGEEYMGSTAWHPEFQLLLNGFDVKRQVTRTFAVKDIHSRRPFTAEDRKLLVNTDDRRMDA